jgi:uncharacterized protein
MSDGVIVEHDVPAPMRDGVTLRANVFRPAGAGPWPTLLTRTPYDKDDLSMHAWCGLDPVRAARAGFVVVVQDVRGRFASGGRFEAFTSERADGYDSVEWAARLPGSSGRVGMYSASYCASTQWLAALERPPSLTAIAPAFTWSEPLDGLFARGGAVELGLALRWSIENGFESLGRAGLGAGERESLIDEWDRLGSDGCWGLPVGELPALRRHAVPDLGGIRAVDDPAFAACCRVAGAYDRVAVPSLHTTGWHDVFLQGTLDNYGAMAATEHEARLVVGPWSHHAFADPIGERRFGMRAARDAVAGDFQLAWFRRHLEPEREAALPEAPVRYFAMGRNEWRDAPAWPPATAERERWYLHRDAVLSTERPEEQGTTEFVFDPIDPVPTVGGNGVLWPGHVSGPTDQAAVEARDDVLVFTSAPLEHDLEVTGRVGAVLYAESSAPSTDWVARLCDVQPDGRSFNVCDGIVRARDGAGACRRYEIDLWSTSNVFLRGHRVRVHVTSSSFPRWDRNLNTGDQRAPRHAVARQRLHHEPDRASYVELPVLR